MLAEPGRPLALCLPALCAALVFALVPSSAHAFCRTTTSQVPAGYDPVHSGCWPEGKPLAWHASRAPYGVASAASKQVPYADAQRAADLAFDAWNGASCSAGGSPAVQAYDDGPISKLPEGGDCTSSNSCNPQTHDVMVFDDVAWPHDDPANTLALTTVTYGVDDGTIFEAYTELNTAQHRITVQPSGGAYDLQAIFTHEAGHFLGLAHATETTSIMYAFYQAPGATRLTSDDVAGICAIYPAGTSSSHGCACEAAPSQARAAVIPGAGILLALAVLGLRRRPQDRP